MIYISRLLENQIKQRLFKGKIVIVYGARQVGKTTLSKRILEEYGEKGRYLNCEILSVERGLAEPEAEKIKAFLGDYKIVVLDEAQNVTNIGKILKIIVDTYPDLQVIATVSLENHPPMPPLEKRGGFSFSFVKPPFHDSSSSFDLSQNIAEPLTGRAFQFILYPLSIKEIKENNDMFFVESKLENILRFGSYPEVFQLSEDDAKVRLNEIASNYLYKDILKFEGLKKSSAIKNLLMLLALQLGSEVSFQELANNLGINRLTVQKYIDILEQSFIVFKLNAFSRNKRKEVSKSIKVYFYDLGIRNSLIENFNRMDIRNDTGALWENFCILERKKINEANMRFVNSYFWRTYDKKEIDYVEETGGEISGFEFKWGIQKTYKPPEEFIDEYKATVTKVGKSNYWKFLGD